MNTRNKKFVRTEGNGEQSKLQRSPPSLAGRGKAAKISGVAFGPTLKIAQDRREAWKWKGEGANWMGGGAHKSRCRLQVAAFVPSPSDQTGRRAT